MNPTLRVNKGGGMSRVVLFSITISIFLFSSLTVSADIIHLKNGRKLEGEVIDKGEKLEIKMEYGSVEVFKENVKKIIKGKSKKQIYKERVKKLNEDVIKSHLKLAMWCKKNELFDEMRAELKKILDIDPYHFKARKLLGNFKRKKGFFIKDAEKGIGNNIKKKSLRKRPKNKIEKIQEEIARLRIIINKDDASTQERLAAVNGLGRVEKNYKRYTIQALMDVLKDDRIDKVKSSISRKGEQKVIDSAKYHLAKIKGATVAPYLGGLSGWTSERIQLEAVDVLGKIKDKFAAKELVKFLDDSKPKVRNKAYKTLKSFGKWAIPYWGKAARSKSGNFRNKVIKDLGKTGEGVAAKFLVPFLLRKYGSHVKEAIAALKKIGMPAVPFLIKALDYRDLRQWSAHTLRQITGKPFGLNKGKWIGWWKGYNRSGE